MGEEVRSLRELIPKALEGQKEAQASALQDLQNELKSLKSLVINRTAAAATQGPSTMGGGMNMRQYPGNGVPNGTPPLDPSMSLGGGNILGSGANGMRKDAGSPLPFGGPGGKPAIPAWQLKANSAAAAAAANNNADAGESASGSQ